MSDKGNNLIDKGTEVVHSSTSFLHSIPLLFSGLILLGIVCAGLATTRAGKIIGQGGDSFGVFIDDVYCTWTDKSETCSASETFNTWWNTEVRKKTEVDLQGNPLPELPGSGGTDQPPATPSQPPTAIPPATAISYPQELIDSVAAITVDWVASKNTQYATQQLDIVQSKWPVETTNYLPYLDMRQKVKSMGEIVQSFFAAQDTITAGTVSDMTVWITNAGLYRDACQTLTTETSSLTTNGYASLTDACTTNSAAMLAFASGYANTTLDQEPDVWLSNMGSTIMSTQWTVIESDDRGGSCHCATLQGAQPVFFKNLKIVVPVAVIEKLFPDKFGFMAGELTGQTLVWP